MDDATRGRLREVLAQHARAQGVNPRDHGVVAIADLRALLTAYDALLQNASDLHQHCERLLAERADLGEVALRWRSMYEACREWGVEWKARYDQAAPVLAAVDVYEDRWENGTDPEVGQARTALLAAIVAWRAARER